MMSANEHDRKVPCLPHRAAGIPAPAKSRAFDRSGPLWAEIQVQPQPAPPPPARRAAPPAAEALEAVRAELLKAGVDERQLEALLDGFARTALPFMDPSVAGRDAVRDHMAARLPVVRDWRPRGAGHTVALVGQTGVGKTSAAAAMVLCAAQPMAMMRVVLLPVASGTA